jgi:hypothetical protein
MITRKSGWFLTYTGKQFYPVEPSILEICIEDIAHALSMICRFGGHCRTFYSVAQHSVLISDSLPPELKLVGLLHDATEAYCGDMVRPLKHELPQYKKVEQLLWDKIARKFDLPGAIPPEVKFSDNCALMTERRDLLVHTDHKWSQEECYPPYPKRIKPLSPDLSEQLFLNTFKILTCSI